MPVYRYKKTGLSIQEVKNNVPPADAPSVSSGSASQTLYWDIFALTTSKADLDDFMARAGWTYESTDPTTDVDEDSASEFEKYGGTGRKTPEHPLSLGGANQLDVAAGTGVIGYNGTYHELSWGSTNINTTGYSEGSYYVYVDNSGTVQNSLVEPDDTQNIRLGGFYHTGVSIGDFEQDPARVDSFMTRVHDFGRYLGAFVANNGGLIQEDTTDLQIVAPAVLVRYGLENYSLTEIDSADVGTRFFCWFDSADDDWTLEHFWVNFSTGKIPTDRWNDTTKNATIALSANCTFTNGSTNVPTASDLTTEVDPGDVVWLDADGIAYMNRVVSINATTITLEENYGGTGGTGASSVGKALPNLDTGKYVKHMLFRTRSDNLHLVIGQEQYDTEDEARDAGGPSIPAAISQGTCKMAFAMVQQGDTELGDGLIDIRPLPFHDVVGGSQGAGVITVHGDLSGLGNDDHTQYHNNTRGDARYYQKTEFLSTSSGAPDAGKPLKLDAAGHVDATMINDGDIDHALIGNVTADQHHSRQHALGAAADHTSATLAQLNALVSDATLDDSSSSRPPSGSAGGDLSGTYPNPTIVDANIDHALIGNVTSDQHHARQHALGSASDHTSATLAQLNALVSDATLDDSSSSRPPSGSAGGDLSGSYPNPTVADLTIASEAQGDILHRNASSWVRLAAGTSGQVLKTQGAGADPVWGTIAHADLTSVTSDQHHAQLHAASHGPSQPDALKLDDLATPDDNTDLNASASTHGLLPKLSGTSTEYLSGAGTWTTPQPGGSAGGDLSGTYPNPTVNDGADSTAIHDNVSGEIAAVSEKTSPASADLVLIEDSGASNAKKRVQLGNILGDSYATTVSSWTVSGDYYYADVTHNLGTEDVFVEAYRTTTKETVLLQTVDRTSTNVVRVWVKATENLRILVTVGGGAGVGAGVDTSAVHTDVAAEISTVTEKASPVSADLVLIEDSEASNAKKRVQVGNLPGGSSLGGARSIFADQFITPVGTDWDVDTLAPLQPDASNSAILVRAFDASTDEAVGFVLDVPAGATNVKFTTRARARSAQTANAILRFSRREIPDNAAIGSWGNYALHTVAIPNNTYFQEDETQNTLATFGLTAGKLYLCQIYRDADDASDTLTVDLDLAQMTVEFT